MARLFCAVQATPEEGLAAATAETVLQIVAPTNQRVVITGWGIAFDGVTVTDEPILVDFAWQDSAGTASSATVQRKDGSAGETVQTSAQQDFTAEPTTTTPIYSVNVHPQSGYEKLFPLGQEVILGGGDRIGIRATIPSGGTAVNCTAWIEFEE